MRSESSQKQVAALPFVAAIIFFLCIPLFGVSQQYVKNTSGVGIENSSTHPAFVAFFRASRENGYNEIEWAALAEQDTRKYIVEYSLDGIDYSSAGELLAGENAYLLKHNIMDERPMLYRIKAEQLNGQSFYSASTLLQGIPVDPVRIYPTIVTNNLVNIIAGWPVERISVFTESGIQVLAKDIGGKRDNMTMGLPNLGKGIYWMIFYGRDWKSTSKFIVP